MCAAEIVPGLELCAYIGPAGSRGLIQPGAIRTGHPKIDGSFALEARSAEGLAALLWPRAPEEERLLDAMKADHVVVTDSAVVARISPDKALSSESVLTELLRDTSSRGLYPTELAYEVDRVAFLANALAARRDRIPVADARARHEAWTAAGVRVELAFDAAAGRLVGRRPGVAIEVALESWVAPQAMEERQAPLSTCLTATFQRPLDLGISVTPAGMFNWLSELVGVDLTIGHAAFDKAFTVRGEPADAVRAILAPAADPLARLAQQGCRVELSDLTLSVLRPGTCSDPGELAAMLELALPAAAALASAPAPGPYR